ncbi:MAG: 30S ribosomal protein S20 [Candidatus Omnitrophica bacterium]|nr:30S ribosomal protein S20 [Candidatus Omnitrophota bacterium]
MPQRKAGIKDLRKNYRKQMHNLDIKSDLKHTIKQFLASVNEKNKDSAQANLKLVYKKLDKAAKRKMLKVNTASRRKSRYARLLATIA